MKAMSLAQMAQLSRENGGSMKGSGDGTKDTILARLANGESVLPTDTVAAIGGGDHALGAKRLAQIIAATHTPIPGAPPTAGPPGFANGSSSPWDSMYAPGGALAARASAPVAAAAPYVGTNPYDQAKPVAVPAVVKPPTDSVATANLPGLSPGVSGQPSYASGLMAGDTRTGAWNDMVDKQNASKTLYPKLANGGLAGYARAVGYKDGTGSITSAPSGVSQEDYDKFLKAASDVTLPTSQRSRAYTAPTGGPGIPAAKPGPVLPNAGASDAEGVVSSMSQAAGGWNKGSADTQLAKQNAGLPPGTAGEGFRGGPVPTVNASGAPMGPPAPQFTNIATKGNQWKTADEIAGLGGQPPAGGMTAEQANQFYGAQNAFSRAAQQQALHQEINRQAEQSRLDAAAPGYRETEMAKGDARVANFHARNAADDITLRGANRGSLAALGVLQAQARDADAYSAGLQARAAAPRTAPSVVNNVANAVGEQAAGANALGQMKAQQDLGQAAQINPLLVEHAKALNPLLIEHEKQKIATGALAQRQAENMQKHQDIMLDPKATEAQKVEARTNILAMLGKTQHEVGRFRHRDTFNEMGMRTGTELYDSTTGETIPMKSAAPAYKTGDRRTMNGVTKEFNGADWVAVK